MNICIMGHSLAFGYNTMQMQMLDCSSLWQPASHSEDGNVGNNLGLTDTFPVQGSLHGAMLTSRTPKIFRWQHGAIVK